jgi:hypothetical protein
MKKLVNKLVKTDLVTRAGLIVVSTIIIPLVTILINEILIKGSTLHF